MDHTFCDFDKHKKIWAEWATTPIEKKYPHSKIGFFQSLTPMKGAIEFYHKWKTKTDIWFLTKPSIPNKHCYTEKANWIFQYLGEEGLNKLIISPRKDIYIGNILIDDSDNCGQSNFQGEWWQFGSKQYPDWITIDSQLNNWLNNYLT